VWRCSAVPQRKPIIITTMVLITTITTTKIPGAWAMTRWRGVAIA